MGQAHPASRRRRIVTVTMLLSALVVFCLVQERVIERGVREYVDRQRAAVDGRSEPAATGAVMRPWVERSVRRGLAAAAPFLIMAALLGRSRRDA